ncbi:hypothetical protein [Segetibacter sp. 3557_3]|uniref:hypothetical protein n=1 Tax=Segetibacter sp. 3557_3 TaxID=2547429 RepID=UPI0014047894|nr:hypothetical protein [Segetibacter sp. 3557_3]
MKKFLLSAFLCATILGARAQTEGTFKPFKFDIAAGYAIPKGSGTKGGVLFSMEPKYALNENFTIGLRMEAALTAHGSIDGNDELINGEVKGSSSYLLTNDYYFSTNAVRPFVGVGAGVYRNAGVNMNSAEDVETSTRFGFAPRIGLETGHFRTAVEYNVAGKSGTMSNNYIGIKIGFFFGGGRLDN